MRSFCAVLKDTVCVNPGCGKPVTASTNYVYLRKGFAIEKGYRPETTVIYDGLDRTFTYCSNRCINADYDRSSQFARIVEAHTEALIVQDHIKALEMNATMATGHPRKYNATDKRRNAIIDIIYKWIGQTPDELGQLVCDGSFDDLIEDLNALRSLGRSGMWQSSINEAIKLVMYAGTTFQKDAEIPMECAFTKGISHYTQETGRDFANMMTWAVHQSAINLNYEA